MHVERVGTGPRTFFGLHGWNGNCKTFSPVTADLPAEASFFAADLPGCGKSQAPNQWTLEAIAEEIAKAICKVPAPVTLVGNCSGALLGLLAAQKLGDRVNRLVTIDMFAVFPWYFRVFLSKLIGRYAYATAFQNPLGRWMTNFSLRSKRNENTTLTGGFAHVDHSTTYRYLQLFESYPQPEAFAALAMPIELLFGEKTFQAVHDSVPRWQSVWPLATATCLTGAGHLPIQEATAQLRAILYHDVQQPPQPGGREGGLCRADIQAIAN